MFEFVKALPSWLKFDESLKSFEGNPLRSDMTAKLDLEMSVHDALNLSAVKVTWKLSVKNSLNLTFNPQLRIFILETSELLVKL